MIHILNQTSLQVGNVELPPEAFYRVLGTGGSVSQQDGKKS